MTNGLFAQWWRIGGICGIVLVVLFVVGAIVLQGDTPTYDQSAAEIREFWADDGQRYLIGDYLIGIGFVIFFLAFLSALRGLLGGLRRGSARRPPRWMPRVRDVRRRGRPTAFGRRDTGALARVARDVTLASS